ncbi:MAG: NADH:flavin oxidoreductase [Deltaproteobacteria bacterium]|nr:NADH:flavin oxidoreductase [Deltaproteobacteria bacterium]MBW2131656.1 NADH:flavin oxidoreductase [Deltaproteobacteria bacterium]
MRDLFQETYINSMKLSNRFVRSATWEGMAEQDGTCTRRLVNLMKKLAAGGVGLIITGHACVHQNGQAGPWQLGVYADHLLPGLNQMTDAVHKKGGVIVLQLAHAGMFADPRLIGERPIGPSDITGYNTTPPLEMTPPQIRTMIRTFGMAARRAQKAGFDGIQLQAAHGYLLSQFLSPAFNRRKDKYGGNQAKRTLFLLEVLGEIRDRVGGDFPVMVKINTSDFLDGGLVLENALEVGIRLQEEGTDAIELSGGTGASGRLRPVRTQINTPEDEAYFKDAGAAFKERLKIPIFLVGGIRSYSVADRILQDGIADYISLSRPLIREPDLIKRWRSGDRRKAACASCNRCFIPIRNGKGVYCVAEKELKSAKKRAATKKEREEIL